MKFLVALLFIGGLVGFGFYQGWFQLGTQSNGGKADITLTVDKDKMNSDEQKAKEQIDDVAHQAKDKAK